jgi:hypothetical protein
MRPFGYWPTSKAMSLQGGCSLKEQANPRKHPLQEDHSFSNP